MILSLFATGTLTEAIPNTDHAANAGRRHWELKREHNSEEGKINHQRVPPPEPESQLTLLRLTSIPCTGRPPPFTPISAKVGDPSSAHFTLRYLHTSRRHRTLPTQSHLPHVLPLFLALPTSPLPFHLRAPTAQQDPQQPLPASQRKAGWPQLASTCHP